MGYTYSCDACGTGFDTAPPLFGEFRESFLKTDGGQLAQVYKPGQTVTICPDCAREWLL